MQNSQEERGDIKSGLLPGIAPRCDTPRYAALKVSQVMTTRIAWWTICSVCILEGVGGVRYEEKYKELSGLKLDILIPNSNFITHYFCIRILSSTLKKKVFIRLWGQQVKRALKR